MNWRKKNTLQYEGIIYNLENWVAISVIKGQMPQDDSKTSKYILKICFSDHDGESPNLFANYSFCQSHNMDKLLGLDAGTIDSLFLAAECRD